MFRIFLCITLLFLQLSSQAQIGDILNRAKNRTNQKINQKIDQAVDKAVDKGFDEAEDAAKKKGNKTGETNKKQKDNAKGSGDESSGKQQGEAAFKSYSKFDFVPGETLLAAEDFSQDAVGDFPNKWNTNGTGEIVHLNTKEGKFLMTRQEVIFYPEWINKLPDNFTVEFDLISTPEFSFYSGWFVVGFSSIPNVGAAFDNAGRFGQGKVDNGGGFEIGLHPENAGGNLGHTFFFSSFNNKEVLGNEIDQDKFSIPNHSSVRVSIWRQKNRIRVYVDDKKIWDLPKGVPEGIALNSLYFRNDGSHNENDSYYIGNLRVAVGAPDTRNKLITEGKFVSHGILFDVNSDKIKPQSYGAIKDIANVLTENADVNVMIIGHTDSDGDDASNLALSKKRAAAVKNTLVSSFGIDASRLSADGKGESEPVGDNKTPLGKAENRRVEFVKQ